MVARKGKKREEEILELKEILLFERKKILFHLEEVQNESTAELSELSGDPADLASIEISQSSRSKLGIRQRKLLSKIDLALSKFEDGTYGICELTGEEIPIARLFARPVAQYTVEAKEELERKERGFRERSEFDDFAIDETSEGDGTGSTTSFDE
jgi:DnaK suppressor protein